MNKNILIGILIIIVLILGGYAIWKTVADSEIAALTDQATNVQDVPNIPPLAQSSTASQTVPPSSAVPISPQHSGSVAMRSYAGNLSFSFDYPFAWTAGNPTNAVGRSGETLDTEVDFTNQGPYQPVFSIVSFPSGANYNYAYSNTGNQQNYHRIQIGGHTAVETSSVESSDIHGNTYNPAMDLVNIDVLDNHGNDIELHLMTPATDAASISEFNQIISSIQFN